MPGRRVSFKLDSTGAGRKDGGDVENATLIESPILASAPVKSGWLDAGLSVSAGSADESEITEFQSDGVTKRSYRRRRGSGWTKIKVSKAPKGLRRISRSDDGSQMSDAVAAVETKATGSAPSRIRLILGPNSDPAEKVSGRRKKRGPYMTARRRMMLKLDEMAKKGKKVAEMETAASASSSVSVGKRGRRKKTVIIGGGSQSESENDGDAENDDDAEDDDDADDKRPSRRSSMNSKMIDYRDGIYKKTSMKDRRSSFSSQILDDSDNDGAVKRLKLSGETTVAAPRRRGRPKKAVSDVVIPEPMASVVVDDEEALNVFDGKEAGETSETTKRGRGRPRKVLAVEQDDDFLGSNESLSVSNVEASSEAAKQSSVIEAPRRRGRPKKIVSDLAIPEPISDAADDEEELNASDGNKVIETSEAPRRRGRPKKIVSDLAIPEPISDAADDEEELNASDGNKVIQTSEAPRRRGRPRKIVSDMITLEPKANAADEDEMSVSDDEKEAGETSEPVKRGRGRPKKVVSSEVTSPRPAILSDSKHNHEMMDVEEAEAPRRRVGRPRKSDIIEAVPETSRPQTVGRPRKSDIVVLEEDSKSSNFSPPKTRQRASVSAAASPLKEKEEEEEPVKRRKSFGRSGRPQNEAASVPAVVKRISKADADEIMDGGLILTEKSMIMRREMQEKRRIERKAAEGTSSPESSSDEKSSDDDDDDNDVPSDEGRMNPFTRVLERRKGVYPEIPEPPSYNRDYCNTCNEYGTFICCEGCPKSFHFVCADPPVDPARMPEGSWFCRECRAALFPPVSMRRERRSQPNDDATPSFAAVFDRLRDYLVAKDPEHFELPKEIQEAFDHVACDPWTGNYIDLTECRNSKPNFISLPGPPQSSSTNAHHLKRRMRDIDEWIGRLQKSSREEEGVVVKRGRRKSQPQRSLPNDVDDEGDAASLVAIQPNFPLIVGKNGEAIGCFRCDKSSMHGNLIKCDLCPLFFHWDCLDPPLTFPPKKWICPNHTRHVVKPGRIMAGIDLAADSNAGGLVEDFYYSNEFEDGGDRDGAGAGSESETSVLRGVGVGRGGRRRGSNRFVSNSNVAMIKSQEDKRVSGSGGLMHTNDPSVMFARGHDGSIIETRTRIQLDETKWLRSVYQIPEEAIQLAFLAKISRSRSSNNDNNVITGDAGDLSKEGDGVSKSLSPLNSSHPLNNLEQRKSVASSSSSSSPRHDVSSATATAARRTTRSALNESRNVNSNGQEENDGASVKLWLESVVSLQSSIKEYLEQ